MPIDQDYATSIPDDSPNNSALAILRIVKEEAGGIGATLAMEEHKEGNINCTVRVSLKKNGNVFRITLSWVRDECLNQAGILGTGYIQTDWSLRLACKDVRHPSDQYGLPPFRWQMEKYLTDEERAAGPPFPPKRTLDADLLRQVIREKLGVLP